jgi:hypothetical protein
MRSFKATTSAFFNNSPKLKLNAELLRAMQGRAQQARVQRRSQSSNRHLI